MEGPFSMENKLLGLIFALLVVKPILITYMNYRIQMKQVTQDLEGPEKEDQEDEPVGF